MIGILCVYVSAFFISKAVLDSTCLLRNAYQAAVVGILGHLFLQNLLGQVLESSQIAAWLSVLLLVLLALPAVAKLSANEKRNSGVQLSRSECVFLLSVVSLVFFYTSLSQNLLPDDDSWIHTPLQGILRYSSSSLMHPYFADIEMQGHYGRNLSIVGLSALTNWDVLLCQAIHSIYCQVLSVFGVFFLVRSHSSSRYAPPLSVILVFFGVGVGGRGGLLDTHQNNNPFVYMTLFFLLDLLCIELSRPRAWMRGLLTASLLSTLAFVYETHFGLVFLATLTLSTLLGFLLQSHQSDRRNQIWAILGLAGILALIQGGPFTTLAKGQLAGEATPHTVYSPGELNQRQIIPIQFPKQELVQLQLGYGNYQRRSCAFACLPWSPKISPGTPYAYLWSTDVLMIYWIVTLTAPIAAIYCWRKRALVGVFSFFFGFWATLVPGLVHFGPVYEFEYFRWLFAAGVSFAILSGVALGSLLDSVEESWSPRLILACLLPILLLATLPTWNLFLPRAYRQWAASGRSFRLLLPLESSNWIRFHSRFFRFEEEDFQASAWLQANSKKDQSLLTNFSQKRPRSILFESTLVGLTGVRTVGHDLPCDDDPVGTSPYRMSALARRFWNEPDGHVLALLDVDWVYLRHGEPRTTQSLENLPELEKVWSASSFSLFRVKKKELPKLQNVLPSERPAVNSISLSFPEDAYAGSTEKLVGWFPTDLARGEVLAAVLERKEYDSLIIVACGSTIKVGKSVELWFEVPHQPGTYRMSVHLLENGQWTKLSTSSVTEITVKEPLGRTEHDMMRLGPR